MFLLNTKLNYIHAHTIMLLVANKVGHEAYFCTNSVSETCTFSHNAIHECRSHYCNKKKTESIKKTPDETLLYLKILHIHMGSILVLCILKLFDIKTKTFVGLHYYVIYAYILNKDCRSNTICDSKVNKIPY